MEILILIIWLSICRALPSPKIETYREINTITQEENEVIPSIITNSQTRLENTTNNKRITSRKKTIDNSDILQAIEKINSLKNGRSRTFATVASFAVGGLLAALDLVEEVLVDEETTSYPETTTNFQVPTATSDLPTEDPQATTDFNFLISTLANDIISNAINKDVLNEIPENSTIIRQPRQEDDDEDEGGGGGLLGAIISGFLGSLSKPDGSVDVDAVVGVIGMLSAMNEDGTYNFQGLSDTLSAFFGGGGDDGGGSDVGSFVGGLLAASIGGIASPPGAKGVGTFTGNILKQLLPASSGPGPTAEGATTMKPQVNAGGFLWGLLNSLFGGNGNESGGMRPSFVTIKMNLLKFVFSALSSILTSSSGGKRE